MSFCGPHFTIPFAQAQGQQVIYGRTRSDNRTWSTEHRDKAWAELGKWVNNAKLERVCSVNSGKVCAVKLGEGFVR